MTALLSTITGRVKAVEAHPSRPGDFSLGETRAVAPRIVLEEPGWSPYCIDPVARTLCLVKLPADVDLSRVPFYFTEQYRRAEQFLALPLDALHDLVAGLPDPETVFIFSIGRCGTTLVSQLLSRVPKAWSVSEPDCFNQQALGPLIESGANVRELIADLCRLLFAVRTARDAEVLCVKFRSQSLFQAEHYFAARPDAKFVFIYRDALSWADSFMQFHLDVGVPELMDTAARDFAWMMISGGAPLDLLGRSLDLSAPWVHGDRMFAAAWLLHLEAYLTQLDSGIPYYAFRYGELVDDREAVVGRLLRHSGLPVEALADALAAFAEDSQKGTMIARKGDKARLGPENIANVRAVLARNPRLSDPNLILPDSYSR